MSATAGYMVFFMMDDWEIPMGHDPDVDGGLNVCGDPVLFTSRADAQKAIRISRKAAELAQAQGRMVNDDFLPPATKCIKVRKVVHYATPIDAEEGGAA